MSEKTEGILLGFKKLPLFIKDVEVLAGILIISLIATALRAVVDREARTLLSFLRDLVIAVAVGFFAGVSMLGSEYGEGIQLLVISLSAFLAPEILKTLLKLAKYIQNKDPEDIVDRVIKKK